MKRKIAITGGIGSGKSFVLNCAREMGHPTFSCDAIYREICQTKEYIDLIAQSFPECVTADGLDRKKLAACVFNNPPALKKLNQIAHPIIMNELFKKMEEQEGEFVFAEVPLLFEGNYENDFHETIYVKRNQQARIESVKLRDNLSKEEILNRIKNQFDIDSDLGKKKLQNAHVHVFENNETELAVKNWLTNFLEKLSRI